MSVLNRTGKFVETAKKAFRQSKGAQDNARTEQAFPNRIALNRLKAFEQKPYAQKSGKGGEKLTDDGEEKGLFIGHAALEVHGKESKIELHASTPLQAQAFQSPTLHIITEAAKNQ